MVTLYIATSIDGFISTKDGSVDWLENPELFIEGEDYGYKEFYDSIDATIMGKKTFDQVIGFDVPFPYPDKDNFVITSDSSFSNKHAETVNDLDAFYHDQIANSKKHFWLVGGGALNTYFAKKGWIDQIKLSLIPVFLGEGIPIFNSEKGLNQFKLDKQINFEKGVSQQYYLKTL